MAGGNPRLVGLADVGETACVAAGSVWLAAERTGRHANRPPAHRQPAAGSTEIRIFSAPFMRNRG